MRTERREPRFRSLTGMLFVCLLSFLCGCPQPPNVQITVPEEGQVFTASPIAVSGTVTDEKPGVSATLSLGGQSWPLSLGTGGAFSREVALQEGENLISVTARDTDNLTTLDSVTAHYAGPVSIQILSPPDGLTVNSERVTVRGSVGGSGVSVLVNGVWARVASGSFEAQDVPLVAGTNQVTATALHSRYESLVGTDAVVVQTVESRDPVELQASAGQGVPPLGVDFTLTVDLDHPVVNYKWDLNADGLWEIDSPSQNTASTSYAQARIYNARVMVTDSQGVSFSDAAMINVHGPAQLLGSFASGNPADIVRKRDGRYLVLDSSACRVSEYDALGSPTGFGFGSCGTGNGQFQSPMGLAVGPHAEIYVADTGNNRVQKFTSQGNFILAFSTWTCGSSTGPFNQPYGIAVDSDSRVFVIDRGNERLMSYDYGFGDCGVGTGAGFFDDPRRVEVDTHGRIYVVGNGLYNQNKGSVNVFSSTGQYLLTINEDTGVPLSEPYDVLVENGKIYIADSGAGKVIVLNDDLDNLRVLNEVAGVAAAPKAVAVGARTTHETVLAPDSGAVLEAELPVDSPEPVWEAFRLAVVAKNFQQALTYVHEDTRAGYEYIFSLKPNELSASATEWTPITAYKVERDRASYDVPQEEIVNGSPQIVRHMVSFVRDAGGVWKILKF